MYFLNFIYFSGDNFGRWTKGSVTVGIQISVELTLSFFLTSVWRIVGEPSFQEIVEKTLSQAFKVILPAASVVSGVSPPRGNKNDNTLKSAGRQENAY